ncbi:type II secretion system F family protein [Candidatus Parcubacteria bacterium]|nr:type II secretion system F family protein [Candidatus Parcubacteria bacterium]
MLLHYQAKGADGSVIEGDRESPDKFSLAADLRAEGLMPFLVTPKRKNPLVRLMVKMNEWVQGVSLHEKIVFSRNLAAMLGAGLAVSRSLEILEKQTENAVFRSTLEAIGKDIKDGGTLSRGLAKFPSVFSSLFVAMVHAGEESGGLPGALREVAIHLEKHYALVRKVRGAMLYPIIIICAVFVIGALMLIYVVPTLTSTFKELGVALPASTRFIIFVSDLLVHYTVGVLAGAIALGASFFLFLRTPRGGRAFDYILLKLPFVGNLAREVNSARTARTLSSLLTAGVSVTESLFITKEVLQNSYYKEALASAVERIEKGTAIAEIFKEHENLFPVMVGEMTEVGEETGKLSEMLLNVATFYEEEVETATKDLSTVIEPLLMVVIGAAVGFFAISMVAPTYSLLNNI